MGQSNLSVGLFGDKVSELHDKLTRAGVDVPQSELKRQFYGPGTRAAVQQIQSAQGLPATGEVDPSTHAVLTGAASPTSPPAAATPLVSSISPSVVLAGQGLAGIVAPTGIVSPITTVK